MNKRQRKKYYKGQFLHVKTKNKCVCGKKSFKINNHPLCCVEHSTAFCYSCGRDYNYDWINHRRIKILY